MGRLGAIASSAGALIFTAVFAVVALIGFVVPVVAPIIAGAVLGSGTVEAVKVAVVEVAGLAVESVEFVHHGVCSFSFCSVCSRLP